MRLMFAASSCLMAVCGLAYADSFTGNFNQDDEIQMFTVTLGETATVTIQTFSFAGGTNGAGTLISAGGYAPVLTLFDSSGQELATDHNNLLGYCTTPDPASGFCWDAQINQLLNPGQYTVALTQDDNYANGPNLSDGFSEQGQGNFTAVPPFSNSGSPFTLIDGSQRTDGWALDITSDSQDLATNELQPVPEPSARLALLLVFAFATAYLRFRRKLVSAK